MKKFTEWAEHYGYQDTPEARSDYARYVAELRLLGSKSAALEHLAQAADHIAEMQDVIEDRDGIESLICAYQDASDRLTEGLRSAVEYLSRPTPAVFVQLYHIESEQGYWLAGGFGYTRSLADAGRFSLNDMERHNIDGCTLHRVRD